MHGLSIAEDRPVMAPLSVAVHLMCLPILSLTHEWGIRYAVVVAMPQDRPMFLLMDRMRDLNDRDKRQYRT